MQIKRHIKRRVEVTAKEVWELLAAKYDFPVEGEAYFEMSETTIRNQITILNESTSEQDVEPL